MSQLAVSASSVVAAVVSTFYVSNKLFEAAKADFMRPGRTVVHDRIKDGNVRGRRLLPVKSSSSEL